MYFSQITLILKRELIKNLYSDIVLIIYIIFNFIILYTSFGERLFALKSVNTNDIKIIVSSVILYNIILFSKKILRKRIVII